MNQYSSHQQQKEHRQQKDSDQHSQDLEEGLSFSPDFKKRGGVLPCIVQEVETKEVLMLAYVNPRAVHLTRQTGLATFYSLSRQKLWTKGETSGNQLKVMDILIDCDQDSLLYQVRRLGGGACHTKTPEGTHRVSCFYRRLSGEGLEHRS